MINAASYLVVIGALVALRTERAGARPLLGRAKGKLREGFAYVRSHPDVARPLLVMTIVGIVAYNFQTTFPSMVRFGFHRGAGSVGAAMSVSAIGSIIGGIYIAGVKPHPRRTLAIALAGFGASCVALSLAPEFWSFVVMSIVARVRIGLVPVGEHRRPAAGHRTGDAGPGDGPAPDGVVRQHADRRAADGLGHPGLVPAGPVRARRTDGAAVRGGSDPPALEGTTDARRRRTRGAGRQRPPARLKPSRISPSRGT